MSTPNLALPLAWNRYGVQEKDNLVPTHVIKKVGGYYDIYSSWLKKANTLAPSYEFVWDWRRSIREGIALYEINSFLE